MPDQPTTRQKVTNGLDVIRLHDTIKLLRENPDLAKFQFRAHNKWVDGAHLQNTVHDFYGAGQEMTHAQSFTMQGDEPDILIGTDYGPNATESLLAALASCVCATLIYHASARGITVKGLEIDMEGDIDLRGFLAIDENVKKEFQNIRMNFRVDADASDEQIQELCKMAQKYSPVFNTVTKGVLVEANCQRMTPTGGEPRQAM